MLEAISSATHTLAPLGVSAIPSESRPRSGAGIPVVTRAERIRPVLVFNEASTCQILSAPLSPTE